MDLLVREVMHRDVHTVHPEMALAELDEQFASKKVSGFPVVDAGKLVGIVSLGDVIRRLVVEREVAEATSDFFFDNHGFHEMPTESLQQIADRFGEQFEQLRVKDLMSRKLFKVPPDQPLRLVAQKMVDNHIHRVLITEEDQLVGIVSALDLVRLIANGRVMPTT